MPDPDAHPSDLPDPDAPAPEITASSELASEQRHVDAAYARLDAMRRSAERVAAGYTDVQRGGTFQARLEREAAEAYTRRRLAGLDIGETPLCFGRLDLALDSASDAPPDATPSPRGRGSRVTDEDLPTSPDRGLAAPRWPSAFYRATGGPADGHRPPPPLPDPLRASWPRARRRGMFRLRAVTDADGLTIVGEAPLLAALERRRTGRMRDIVATIQAEQDEAIRAPLTGAAHRVGRPWHREDGRRPAPRRLPAVHLPQAARLPGCAPRRAEPDLPAVHRRSAPTALGEDEVTLAVPASLKPRLTVRGTEPSAVAALKSDARMAKVIARQVVRDQERPMPRDVVTMLDGHRLVLRRRESARISERARARRGTHNARRPYFLGLLLDHFRREYQRALVAEYRHARGSASTPTFRGCRGASSRTAKTSRWPRPWRVASDPHRSGSRELHEHGASSDSPRCAPRSSGCGRCSPAPSSSTSSFGFEALDALRRRRRALGPRSSAAAGARARVRRRPRALDRCRPALDRRGRRAARAGVGRATACSAASQP